MQASYQIVKKKIKTLFHKQENSIPDHKVLFKKIIK